MHRICHILLSAIHVAAAGFACVAGALPEAICAALCALVYAALAAGTHRLPPR